MNVKNWKCVVITLMILNSLSSVVYAKTNDEGKNYVVSEDEVIWGLDVSAGKQQQTFAAGKKKISLSQTKADLTTLSLDPLLQYDNWYFSLALPWYENKGDYTLRGNTPNNCAALEALTPAQRLRRIKNIKGAAARIAACDLLAQIPTLESSHSGMGDVTAFARYSIPLDDDGVWSATPALGYKSDTGNSQYGLGTGTSDLLAEFAIGMIEDKTSLNLVAGYNVVLIDNNTNTISPAQNYVYSSVDASQQLLSWMTLGGTLNVQKSNIENGEDTKSFTAYFDFLIEKKLNLHCYATKYATSTSLPDSEIGANIRYSF